MAKYSKPVLAVSLWAMMVASTAFAGEAEVRFISEIFDGAQVRAEQFGPVFLSQAPVARVQALLDEVTALVGPPVVVTGEGQNYTVTTATHTIEVIVMLDDQAIVRGMNVSPPVAIGAALEPDVAVAVAFDQIVGKYAISASTVDQTTVEFLVKKDVLFFKDPGGNELEIVISADHHHQLKVDGRVKFIFTPEGAQSLAGFTLDQRGQKIDFQRLADIQQQVVEQNNTGDASAETAHYAPPPAMDDGLPVAGLADVASQPKLIYKLLENIEAGAYGEIDGFLIIKNGTLVVEKYGEYWSMDQSHLLQSISKSVTSLIVGSAIEQGHIGSVTDRISTYLPDHQDMLVDGKEVITIEHLLTMTAGLEWNEANPPYTDPKNIRVLEATSDDSIGFTLSRPLVEVPGEVFNYNGGAVTVVGEIIKNATGAASMLEYLTSQSTLAALNFENTNWQFQADGRQNAAGGAAMRPRDLAKIGQLVLDEGAWLGAQLLSKDWIATSLAHHVDTPSDNLDSYGYYWWGRDYTLDGKIIHESSGQGYGGQELLIVDALDLVVVITATNYDRPVVATRTMMTKFILPAFADAD